MRRVAVTGMGVISPVGNDRSSFWNNLIAGKNGIGLLTRFDTSEQKVKVAAQVEDFDPVQYMERAQVRKTDLFAQYAMAAAVQAMQDAGLCANENIQPERLGVYVGSGCGGINTITEQCSKFWESGPRHVSPFLIPMMNWKHRFGQYRHPLSCARSESAGRHRLCDLHPRHRGGIPCHPLWICRCYYCRRSGGSHQRGWCGWLCKLQSADHLRGPGKRLLAL